MKQRRLEEECCWRDGGDQASVALSNNVPMKAATTSVGDITGRCADMVFILATAAGRLSSIVLLLL